MKALLVLAMMATWGLSMALSVALAPRTYGPPDRPRPPWDVPS